jgi:exopolysaccharide biosynthesis polyprenyl glycosylphosphotransferase
MTLRLAIFEASSLFAAVFGALALSIDPRNAGPADLPSILAKALTLSICCVVSFYYNDLYDPQIVRRLAEFLPRLVQALGVAFILLAAIYSVFPHVNIADGGLVSSVLVVVALLVPIRAISYGVMGRRPFLERVLIVGTSPLAWKVVHEIDRRPSLRYAIVGVADDAAVAAESPRAYPLLGPLAHLDKIVEEVRPQRIIVGLAERRGRLPMRSLLEARLAGHVIEDAVNVYERLTGKLAIESLTPSNLVFSHDFKKSRLALALGRIVSLVVSITGLLVLLPLLAVVAVMIKLDSVGPVFFVQDRVGLCGRRFKLIKFRTMHPARACTSEWAQDNAGRITRLGAWLRKFRIDELPQFVNIIRGDMNLVGPRPHPVSNFELFAENIPYYSVRSAVRPGVTGWAQVRFGYANNLAEEIEKMRYDFYYIKHLSLALDLRILIDTLKTVLFGRGARSAAVDGRASS